MRILVVTLALMLASLSVARAQETETAVLAGGCFWCVESDFDQVKGVEETISGFAGGDVENPTYRQVSRGGTGHREAEKITFDPSVVSYRKILELFMRSIDPTDAGGQFCDRGHSYTTAIYPRNDAQAKIAREVVAEAEKALGRKVVTEVGGQVPFYPAEEHHQNYYKKNPLRYSTYRRGCGRDARVRALWGDAAAFADHG